MSRDLPRPKILLVDDDEAFRQVLGEELRRRKYRVDAVATGAEALESGAAAEADVILLDLRLPDMDGIEVLEGLRRREVPAGVVLLTGHGTIDTAIRAIRLGAYDYLEKPCPIEKIEMTIQKTCEHLGLLARQRVLQDGFSPPDPRHGLIGTSPAFRRMCQRIEKIAPTEAATLVQGETGTGKEMVATLLHTLSPRKEAPFVVLNCAALHEELLQSELFGHEKGAFSGAVRRKHGLFEVAHGGTLFLDEVGDTSPESQAALLRVLETGCFRRLGGTQEITVDVRLISATNRELRRNGQGDGFREDLYFRLSTMRVEVPPLRERLEDLPTLVEHFSERLNCRLSRQSRLGSEAMAALHRYDWPGNVRELIHVLEHAFVLSDRKIIPFECLPRSVRESASERQRQGDTAPPASLREVEWNHIQAVLERVGGNRAQAAGILGISERNLYRLIRRHSGDDSRTDPRV